ncbi:MAG TPA: hypothetical protein VGC74_04960 [Stenotrophomonas sp.]|jgi:hypothetical protein
MKWHPNLVAAALCLTLAPMAGFAQVPAATRAIKPVAAPTTVPAPPPPLSRPPVTPAPSGPIPSKLGQRAAPTPIQANKPTQSTNSPAPSQDDPARRIGTTPARVYGSNGLPVVGMEQAGPNRVRDSRTGRYYDTKPTGDGQRIVP